MRVIVLQGEGHARARPAVVEALGRVKADQTGVIVDIQHHAADKLVTQDEVHLAALEPLERTKVERQERQVVQSERAQGERKPFDKT